MQKFFICSFHAFTSYGTGILNLPVGGGFYNTTRTRFLLKLWIFGVIVLLWCFLGIKVLEVTKKLIENMVGLQVSVLISQVIFAEFTANLALLFNQIGDIRCPIRNAMASSRHANCQ
jgi:hypothetical protein